MLLEGWLTAATEWHVNPTGKFVIGGPDGDAGLTGRKIIGIYGGAAPHGGGASRGKTQPRWIALNAYAARYLAKNGCGRSGGSMTIWLSYAIGVAKPLSIYADTHGTGNVDEAAIACRISGDGPDVAGIRTHLI